MPSAIRPASFAEERWNVAMAFDHVDNFQRISDVAKKDDVRFVRMTAQVGAKFIARASHADRRGGKIGTFAA